MDVLFVNSAVSNLIREGKDLSDTINMQTAKGRGLTVLNDAL
jgi:Tfp pilus assembly pilus retraction ATPase PilT